jgi:hypothetical protein
VSYGRLPIKDYKAEKEASRTPSCSKCHHAKTSGAELVCGHWKGHELDPDCGDFDDVSRERNYYPNFDYDGRFRR